MARRLSVAEAEEICRQNALPLTVQRRTVLEALAPRLDHPTADDLFGDVRGRAPEISRTTVYRVLEAFVRIGVARKVCHPGAAARYEMLRDKHHHLVCLKCGKMVDFEDSRLDELPFPVSSNGFEVKEYTIQFRGVCGACASAPAKPKRGVSKKKGRTVRVR